MKTLRLFSIICATLLFALPAQAELIWLMRLDSPPLRVSPHDVVTVTGTLINSPDSTENLGVFTSGPSGPPGDYNMAVFANTCPGWTWAVDGVHFSQQFVGVDLAPGESFDFVLGQCIPPAEGYPNRVFYFAAQLQLVSRALGRQVGTSTDYARWLVSDLIQPLLPVDIIINPGATEGKVVVQSGALLSVAILSTSQSAGDSSDFDATQLDPTSIQFGPAAAFPVGYTFDATDIDGDGDTDLVVRFPIQDTGLTCNDAEAELIGQTFDGRRVAGSSPIITLGCGR